MKIAISTSILALLLPSTSEAFSPKYVSRTMSLSSTSLGVSTEAAAAPTEASSASEATKLPLLIRAALGREPVERVPVWMMRQAGRHMQCYRDLCKEYPTFRQRSEITDVAVEISLQPHRAYQTDGCILFSDILTPLPGMGANFQIDEKLGPVMEKSIATWDDAKMLHAIDPTASTPFVGEALEALRKAVSPETAVLGFVGCPYTLATYLVEGKTSKEYLKIKCMALEQPQLLHHILQILADNIGDYALYQIEHGAQLIQVFDSWAGHLSPAMYDEFAAPYQKQMLDKIKAKYPDVPTVMYIKHSGALLERMAATGVDVVSLDWTVDIAEGRQRVLNGRAKAGLDVSRPAGIQGNLDPATLLCSDKDVIRERTLEILKKVGKAQGHVMNLGHGIEAATPEENAAVFIETVRNFRYEE